MTRAKPQDQPVKERKAPAVAKSDPIFGAIAEHKALFKKMFRLSDKLDKAEFVARETHGPRPDSLIAWREQIENEYRDAKAREAAAERAGAEWDERVGIAPLREQYGRTRLAERKVAMRMARTKPVTPAGAAAMVDYVRRDIDIGESVIGWPSLALKTVARALVEMNAEAA